MYFYLNGCTLIQNRNDCSSVFRGIVLLETYQYFVDSFPRLHLRSTNKLLSIIDRGVTRSDCLVKSGKTKKRSTIITIKKSSKEKESSDIHTKIYLALSYLDQDEKMEFLSTLHEKFKESFRTWQSSHEDLINKIMEHRINKKVIFIDILKEKKHSYRYEIYQLYPLSESVIQNFNQLDKKLLKGMNNVMELQETK